MKGRVFGAASMISDGEMPDKSVDSGGSNALIDLDVLVIGGGFGGCYLLKLLRENGFKTRIVEQPVLS